MVMKAEWAGAVSDGCVEGHRRRATCTDCTDDNVVELSYERRHLIFSGRLRKRWLYLLINSILGSYCPLWCRRRRQVKTPALPSRRVVRLRYN